MEPILLFFTLNRQEGSSFPKRYYVASFMRLPSAYPILSDEYWGEDVAKDLGAWWRGGETRLLPKSDTSHLLLFKLIDWTRQD